jgi:uncharacterized protein (DUF736 family)
MELGTFTKDQNGVIAGTVTTLTTSFDIEYRKVEQVGNGPDYRVYRRGSDVEVGFARTKFGGRTGKPYLNTLIDTPEFAQGIWLALVQEEETRFVMKWSRPRKGNNANHANTNGAAQSATG